MEHGLLLRPEAVLPPRLTATYNFHLVGRGQRLYGDGAFRSAGAVPSIGRPRRNAMMVATARLQRAYEVDRLRRDLEAVAAAESQPQPGPYHAGEWTGISIRAAGGKANVAPSFPSLLPYTFTELAASTPYFREIVDGLGCPVQVVRLLALPPGGHIKRHTDFFTNFQFGLLRLHVPIVTNPDVEFVIGDEPCNWQPGELWYGDFSQPHSVKNAGAATRFHLVIDAEITERLLALFPPEVVEPERAKGISMVQHEIDLGADVLGHYECTFRVPAAAMPILILGKLHELLRGGTGAIVRDGERLVLCLDERPLCRLRPLSRSRFGIEGLSSGCYFDIARSGGRVRGVTLVVHGAQENLIFARLGRVQGPPIPIREIPMEMATI